MGGHDNRVPLSPEEPEAFPDQVACLRVEADGRFVQYKQIRVIDKCPGKDEAALHAPGELIDGCSTLLGERHKLKQVLYPFFCLFRRDVEIPGIGEQVTCTREIRVEVGLLRVLHRSVV